MMYALIQFAEEDGGTLSIVNREWLTPRKCEVHWPPVKGSKAFEKLLPHGSPDEKWKLYGVQRVFCETDSLEKAKEKLKLAEVTSDLQTEEESEIPRPKRKVVKTNRFISSDEEDDNDLVCPPPLKKKFIKLLQDKNKQNPGPSRLSSPKSKNKSLEDQASSGENNSELFIEEVPATEKNRDLTQNILLPTLKASMLEELYQDFQSEKTSEKRLETDNLKLSGYQDKVLSLLTLIKIQNNQILSILKEQKTGVILNSSYKFPLQRIEDLEATEGLLKIQENYDNLVSYIETLGGRDTSTKVSRIMKTLLSDCLAKEFNFYGKRSKKRPFCELLLRKCVVEAVKNVTKSTEKQIEDIIKVWLKHAPERLMLKDKKNS